MNYFVQDFTSTFVFHCNFGQFSDADATQYFNLSQDQGLFQEHPNIIFVIFTPQTKILLSFLRRQKYWLSFDPIFVVSVTNFRYAMHPLIQLNTNLKSLGWPLCMTSTSWWNSLCIYTVYILFIFCLYSVYILFILFTQFTFCIYTVYILLQFRSSDNLWWKRSWKSIYIGATLRTSWLTLSWQLKPPRDRN